MPVTSSTPTAASGQTLDPRRVRSFIGLVGSRLGPRALQLVGGTFLTLLVASRTSSALGVTFALTAHRLLLWLVYPLVGVVSDRTRTRLGRRVPFMAGALLAMALFTWLWTIAPGYWPLVVVILGTRLAAAANSMTSLVAMPEVFGRGRWLRAMLTVGLVGLAVSIVLRGLVVATWNEDDPASWNTTFRVAAMFMAAAGIAVALLVREAPAARDVQPTDDPGTFRERVREFAATAESRLLFTLTLGLVVAGGATSRLFPVYAEEVLGATAAELAIIPFVALPAACVALGVGVAVASLLSRRMWIVLLGISVTGSAAVGVVATSVWQPVTMSILVTGVGTATTVSLLPMYLRLLPTRGGLGERLGLLAGPIGVAAVLGAYAAGILVDIVDDYRSMWWVPACVGVLVALGALGLTSEAARRRGGLAALARAVRTVGGARPARQSRGTRSLFVGELHTADVDATAVLTGLRNLAEAALVDQGPPPDRAARLVSLIGDELAMFDSLAESVTLVDEHGVSHYGRDAVGRALGDLQRQTTGPWRAVDHPGGPAVAAPISDDEALLVVTRRADDMMAELLISRSGVGDDPGWRYPMQRDLRADGSRWRSVRRSSRVVVIACRHFTWPVLRHVTRQPVTTVEWARRARAAFAALGGTYMKFGQLLASSPQLVGPEAADELRGLLDDAAAVPFRKVRAVISRSLGAPLEQCFVSMDPRPIGAASLAVVHRASLLDGRQVAVKVLRPRVAAEAATDLDLLDRAAARLIAVGVPIGQRLAQGVAFLRVQLSEELDLLNECRTMHIARRHIEAAGFDRVMVPEVHEHLCSSSVLTMDYLEGSPLDRVRDDGPQSTEHGPAVDEAIKAWFLLLVRDGWFHGDLHAGNLLLLRDGRVAFLDWGVLGRLGPTDHGLVRDLLAASLDLPGGRDRLVDRFAPMLGVDAQAIGPMMRTVLAERITRPLTTPFGQPRLGAFLEEGPLAGRSGIRAGGASGQLSPLTLDRSMLLVAKQLVYFERYGAVHLRGSHLLSDRSFFAALLDDGLADAGAVVASGTRPSSQLGGPDVGAVGAVEALFERDGLGSPRPVRRRLTAVVPALLLVVGARLVWPSPLGVVLQGALVGCLTALNALGLALFWRSRQVVNFAQGDLGAPVAVAAVLAVLTTSAPVAVAFPIGVAVALCVGFLIDVLVLRRFDRSSRLVVTVATIGLAQLLAGLAVLLPLQVDPEVLGRPFPVFVPGEVIIGGARFDGNDLLIAVATVATVLLLGWILHRTRLGLAVRASALLPDRAAGLGISVRGAQAAVVVIATGLSFLAVFLRVGTTGVPVGQVLGPGLLLRALTAFVIAPRDRLWPIATAALGLGVLEASINYAASDPSVVEPILAVIVAGGLLLRRSRRGERRETTAVTRWSISMRAHARGAGTRLRPQARTAAALIAAVAIAAALCAPLWLDVSRIAALTAVSCLALAAVSLVVVGGWSGHLSLAQLAFAGTGGAVAGMVATSGTDDMLVVLFVAVATGAACGGIAGLPTVRAQGVFYSVTTLAFAVAASGTILDPTWARWIPRGSILRGDIAGVIDLASERSFYWFTLVVVALIVVGVASIGRSHSGRLLRAVRDNPAAAAAHGVDPRLVTLIGFTIGGAVAGAAGGLLVLQQQSFSPSLFEPTESLRLLTAAVTGGLDTVVGALFGAALLYGVEWLSPTSMAWLRLLSSGVGVLTVLLVLPHGIGAAAAGALRRRFSVLDDPPWLLSHEGRPSAAAADAQDTVSAPPGNAMLVARGVVVSVGGVDIVRSVDLRVDAGQIVALVGTNGAGKSTLLDALAGITPMASGRIWLDRVDHSESAPRRRAGAGLVHVPGGRAVFADLTVDEHLELAGWLRGPTSAAARLHDRALAVELIPQVADLLHRRAGDLSGGQQQLLAFAMALVSRPKVLLIDELSFGLAPQIVDGLLGVLQRLRDRGTAIVLVEQALEVALRIADRVVFMERGEVRFEGSPTEFEQRRDLVRPVRLVPSGLHGTRTDGLCQPSVVLRAVGLGRSFGGIAAAEHVSFEIHAGEIVGLLGPNGAGKTTVVDVLSGVTRQHTGEVWMNGRRIDRCAAAQRARLGLIRSFQDSRLFESLTARECVAVSLTAEARWTDPVLAAMRFPLALDADRRLLDRAEQLLVEHGLGDYVSAPIAVLSTGIRRMVNLVCVVGSEPKVVLLDEPAAGIAAPELDGLAARLLQLRRSTGAALLVIEHDLGFISAIADRAMVMDRGRIVDDGPTNEVLGRFHVGFSSLSSTIEEGTVP